MALSIIKAEHSVEIVFKEQHFLSKDIPKSISTLNQNGWVQIGNFF